MSETNLPTEYSNALKQTARSAHERWRLIKDSMARYGVIAGGLGVIVAVVMIFFYLLYVVFPLFLPATAEPVSQYAVPDLALGKTVLLEVEEQNEVAVRFTDTGQVIFFQVATGKPVLTEAVKLPEGAQYSELFPGQPQQ